MSVLTYLIGTIIMFIAGFYSGMQQGEKNGRMAGYSNGIKATLHIVDRYMKGGIYTIADWDSVHQLIREEMLRD